MIHLLSWVKIWICVHFDANMWFQCLFTFVLLSAIFFSNPLADFLVISLAHAMYLELMEGIFYMNLCKTCKTEFHICKFPVEFSIPGVGEFTLWWRSWQYSFPYIHSFEMLFLIVYSVSYILVAVFFDKDHHSDDAGDRHQGSIKWSALGHENSLNVMNPDHRAEQS